MRLFAMLAWLVHLAVFLPLCSSELFGYAGYVDTTEDWFRFFGSEISEESDLIEGLERTFNFFYSDFERVNIDGLLGIVIAEGQLNMIMQKLLVKSALFDKVIDLQNKCHNLIKLLKSKVKISSSTYNKIYNNALETSMWEIDSNFVSGSLDYYPPYNWTTIPTTALIKLVFYDGTPNGKQSEICINEIIDFKSGKNNEEHDCLPSLGCLVIMSTLETSHGYPLTHKLLYIQLARVLQCKTDKETVSSSVNFLCSRILQEFRAIENIPDINVMLQDLYLEQMVLCGMEGFAEFLTHKSREHLLKWQSTYGCYGKEAKSFVNRWRGKREIFPMKYGCESHITGLAAAAMAINLNFLVTTEPRNLESNDDEDFSNILMLSNSDQF